MLPGYIDRLCNEKDVSSYVLIKYLNRKSIKHTDNRLFLFCRKPIDLRRQRIVIFDVTGAIQCNVMTLGSLTHCIHATSAQ